MGDYIYTVLCAGIFSGVIISLSPDTESGRLGKFIAFAGALCMALTLLSPIGDFKREESKEDFGNTAPTVNTKAVAEYYANSAGSTLCSAFSLERSKLSVSVSFAEQKEKPERLSVCYSGEKSFDTEAAERMLSNIYSVFAEVRIAKGENG